MDGPDEAWSMNGWLEIEIYSGLTSSRTGCLGYKQANFPDGTTIRWNQTNDYFTGVFIGTMNHQLTGRITYHDEANGLTAYYDHGAYMFRK